MPKKTGKKAIWVAVLMSTALLSQAQDSSHASQSAQIKIEPGTTFESILTTRFDARKARPGDMFQTTVSSDFDLNRPSLLRGSTVVGHVVKVQLRGKEQTESIVVIEVEKIVLADGAEVPLRAVMTRVEPPTNSGSAQRPASSDIGTRGGSYHAQTNNPGSNDRLERENRAPFKSIDELSRGSSSSGPSSVPGKQTDEKNYLQVQSVGTQSELISAKKDIKLEPQSRVTMRVVTGEN